MWCLFCGCSSRKRMVAKVILDKFAPNVGSIRNLSQALTDTKIYNFDSTDEFTKFLLDSYPYYYCSELIDNVPPGTELRERVFCQDIQNLTFPDTLFDLVITEEVFEHVRQYEKGFKEIYRVLKPRGYHIFTVPFNFDRPTIVRVDTSGEKDIHLLEPEYHGDAARGQILAYRTFGIDIFDFLTSLGFETSVHLSDHYDKRFGIFDSAVFASQKVR